MNEGLHAHRPRGFPAAVQVAALVYLAFLLQLSLVPFDFRLALEASAWWPGRWAHAPAPDMASNVVLYVPAGVLLQLLLGRRFATGIAAAIAAVLLAGALSLGLETLQLFSPSRVSSPVDVLCNGIGAAVGATLSWSCSWLIPGWIRRTLDTYRRRPRLAVMQLYITALALFATVPFLFTADLGRLRHALASAELRPFARDAAWIERAAEAQQAGDSYAYAIACQQREQQWSKWAAEVASFALLALLVFGVLRGDYGFRLVPAALLTWWCGLLLAIGLSAAQLFVLTRGFAVTDLLMRGAGLTVMSALLPLTGAKAGDHTLPPALSRQVAGWGAAATLIFIVYNGVVPGQFAPPPSVEAVVQSPGFSPFTAYFEARFDRMAMDLLGKLLAYAVLGFALAGANGARSSARLTVRATGVALVVSAVIEVVQVFLRARVPSLTDVIIAGAGAFLGVAICVQLRRLVLPGKAKSPATRRGEPPAYWSPADQAISTLTQPQAGAPHEPGSRPAQRPTQSR